MDVLDVNVGVFTEYPHGRADEASLEARIRRLAAKRPWPWSRLARIDWSGNTVLEAGCGGGTKVLPFALRGAHVYGIDGSEVQVQRARQMADRLGVEAAFTVGRLENLTAIREEHDIPEADLVICSAVIHHVAGWRELLPQLVDAMTDGGHLYLTWGDPTLAWGSFNLKNQIAYRLGRDAASRMRVGRRLFGWWDRRRNSMGMGLDDDSFFADLYSAYYIPITAGRMRRACRHSGLKVVESRPPVTVDHWLATTGREGLRQLVLSMLRVPATRRVANAMLRLRGFVRVRHGPRLFVCERH